MKKNFVKYAIHAMAKKIFPTIVPPSARVSLKKGFRLASKSGKYKKKKKKWHTITYIVVRFLVLSTLSQMVFLDLGKMEGWRKGNDI